MAAIALALAGPAQILAAPAPPDAPATEPAEEWAYRITKGDTLIGLARQHLAQPADWRRLQRLNRITDPRRLQPGRLLRMPLAWMAQTATVAEVVFVNGPVMVRPTQAGGPERPLARGDAVQMHESIHTPAQASLTLRFADGSRLLIGPQSTVAVLKLLQLGRQGLPQLQFGLEQGDAEVQVAPADAGRRFDLRTPVVSIGVRGTDFRARVDAAAQITHIEVLKGRVLADAGTSRAAVQAGQGSVAEAGKPVSAPRPLVAAPLLQPLPRIERLPLRLQWPAMAGAKGYRAQVLAADAEDHLLLDAVAAQPQAQWADLPDGRYRLRVRGLDPQGLEGHAAEIGFEIKARPEPPFTHAPAQGATLHGDGAEFNWARVPAAARYRLQVSQQADFSSTIFDSTAIEQPRHQLPLAPGAYHWRVASVARTAGGHDDPGPFGDGQAFSLREVPASPSLAAAERVDSGVLLRWPSPGPGRSVRLQVARDGAFTDIVQDQTLQASSGLLPGLAPGVYHVRAKTIDADGFEGPFGAAQVIEVPREPAAWLWVPLGLLILLAL